MGLFRRRSSETPKGPEPSVEKKPDFDAEKTALGKSVKKDLKKLRKDIDSSFSQKMRASERGESFIDRLQLQADWQAKQAMEKTLDAYHEHNERGTEEVEWKHFEERYKRMVDVIATKYLAHLKFAGKGEVEGDSDISTLEEVDMMMRLYNGHLETMDMNEVFAASEGEGAQQQYISELLGNIDDFVPRAATVVLDKLASNTSLTEEDYAFLRRSLQNVLVNGATSLRGSTESALIHGLSKEQRMVMLEGMIETQGVEKDLVKLVGSLYITASEAEVLLKQMAQDSNHNPEDIAKAMKQIYSKDMRLAQEGTRTAVEETKKEFEKRYGHVNFVQSNMSYGKVLGFLFTVNMFAMAGMNFALGLTSGDPVQALTNPGVAIGLVGAAAGLEATNGFGGLVRGAKPSSLAGGMMENRKEKKENAEAKRRARMEDDLGNRGPVTRYYYELLPNYVAHYEAHMQENRKEPEQISFADLDLTREDLPDDLRGFTTERIEAEMLELHKGMLKTLGTETSKDQIQAFIEETDKKNHCLN